MANPRSDDIIIRVPRLHNAQREIVGSGLGSAPRFRVVICGRRFGKSQLAVHEIALLALKSGKPYGYFAPTYRYLTPMWKQFKRILSPVTTSKNENEHTLELIGGGSIECWSLENQDASRGRSYAGIVIDEAAMVREGGYIWEATLRPTLLDYSGWALFISTPRGRGYLYELYQMGVDPLNTEWGAYRYPTVSNPYIRADEIEAARQLLPDRLFRQEFLAEWIDDSGGVFRNVDGAATGGVISREAAGSDARFVMGVDLARKEDFTVICVIDITNRRQVYMERFNQMAWTHQVELIRRAAEAYKIERLVYDATGVGDAVGEMLAAVKLPCGIDGIQFTAQSKGEIIENLAVAIEKNELVLLDDPYQTSELKSYEMDKLPSGRYRYGAPSGMHDDTVIALALAWHGCRRRNFGEWRILDW